MNELLSFHQHQPLAVPSQTPVWEPLLYMGYQSVLWVQKSIQSSS